MLEGWQWTVRAEKGGDLQAIRPDIDIKCFLSHTFDGVDHELTLTWKVTGEKDYHHVIKRINEGYRLGAQRPQLVWSQELGQGVQARILLDHPDEERGDDTRESGAAFRVEYRHKDKTVPVKRTKATPSK